jgi:hypothetical protein
LRCSIAQVQRRNDSFGLLASRAAEWLFQVGRAGRDPA